VICIWVSLLISITPKFYIPRYGHVTRNRIFL
jgi:hypothetical protein